MPFASRSRLSVALLCTAIGAAVGALSIAVARLGRPTPLEASAAPAALPSHVRQPVALALVENGKLLLAANRRSGTISVIDAAARTVIAEHAIGEALSDIAALPGTERYFLATDETAHRLLLLERDAARIAVAAELAVPEYPVSVKVADDSRRCFVASLWSRRLTAVALAIPTAPRQAPALRVEWSVPLPFAPRVQLWHAARERLVVADSFSGWLAVLEPAQGTIESLRRLPAHNIRGMALSRDGDKLYVGHQILSRLARTSEEDVHWGTLMMNVVRELSVDSVFDPAADLLKGSRSRLLGDVGRAAGDPGAIALAGETIAVAFSGVGEVGLLSEAATGQRRIAAGARPTAVVAGSVGGHELFYVADTLGDAVFVIDAGRDEPLAEIPLGPRDEPDAVERGERLFYDARLSHDGWMSCHSCHTDGHSSDQLNDNLGDGSFDAPKRVLSLLGVADTAPFGWNGGMPDLEGQIRKSIATTMHGPEPSNEQVAALAAYLRSLASAPAAGVRASPDDERGDGGGLSSAAERGRALFHRFGCDRCHALPAYTSPGTYDVGPVDEVGNARFNPPSLRGVSQRGTLFHDSRAQSLGEAFTRHRHQVPDDAADQEIADLVEFLRTL